MFVRQNKKFSIEGNKMKKFSSLCLALFLSFSGLFNLIANAALVDISFEGLNARGVADEVAYCRKNFSYTLIEQCFVSLLEEMGKVETARLYEAYRSQFVNETFNEGSEEAISLAASEFFSKFTPDLSDPKAVGLYALIHNESFERAVEILALINNMSFEEAMNKLDQPLE